MSLYSIGAVTVDRYRVYTGDDTTPGTTVSGALVEAERLLNEELRRELASEERTETLRIQPDGRVWPRAYPITAAPLTIDGRSLLGATPDLPTFVALIGVDVPYPVTAAITYTGGYTAATFPVTLEHAVYDLAHGLAVDTPAVLVGARSATVGDVSVTYGTSGDVGPVDSVVPGLSARVGRYHNRFVK